MQRLLASALLACILAAPPPGADFETTLQWMRSEIERIESGEWPSREELRKAISRVRAEGLATIDFESLTTEQIDRLTRIRFFGSLGYVPDYIDSAVAALDARTQDASPEGAYAASVRASILSRDPARADAAPLAALEAIRHPAAPQLLLDDRGDPLFAHACRALRVPSSGDGPPPGLPAIQSFIASVPADFDPGNLSAADNLYERLATHDDPAARALAEPTRARLLTLGKARLQAGDIPLSDRWWPELRLAFLEHGPQRLNLLNNPAPDIEFAWWSDEAAPIRRLSDLRGEILVIDVWASDCGFCLPALQARADFAPSYESKGVRFIALTEHAREFVACYDTGTTVPTPTTLDTARAAAAYHEKNRLAGSLAVIDDSTHAFAASFGVRGVPTTIVIDHNGAVRGLDHDPRRPDQTAELLNTLLQERRGP